VSKQTKRDGLKAYQHQAVIMKMMMVMEKRHAQKPQKFA
jgi:hypothetical protein